MAKLVWNQPGERIFETGVDRGVLFVGDGPGVPWNGLVSVTEAPSGAEATAQYAGNKKYINQLSMEEFGGTIEAFTYPEEFEACDGSANINGITINQQTRVPFGFSYRTLLGNDIHGTANAYKIHLVYNAIAAPTEVTYSSTDDAPEALTFAWEFSTTPIESQTSLNALWGENTMESGGWSSGLSPFSHITIDTTKVYASLIKRVESILYGDAKHAPRLIYPTELEALQIEYQKTGYGQGQYGIVPYGGSTKIGVR